jgi:hypothetical protein
MNTRKTVYNKLFKEETKLATHEVELGIIDEAKKGMEMVLKAFNNPLWKTLDRLPSEVGDTLARIKSDLQDAGKGQAIAIQKARQISEMSKELGAELPKDIQKIFDNNDYDDMLQAYENGINKLTSSIKK